MQHEMEESYGAIETAYRYRKTGETWARQLSA